jgi:hypothetical protein
VASLPSFIIKNTNVHGGVAQALAS